MNRPLLLFAGGGTGGHLFPGVAVAETLSGRDPSCRIVFAGSDRDIERRIVTAAGYEHVTLPVEPSTSLRRSPFRYAGRNWRAYRRAGDFLTRERPAAVIGLGGFASVPVVLAAARRRIPVLLMEQNAVCGRATRWLCRFADRICLTFAESVETLPKSVSTAVTGNPVRREITALADRPATGGERRQRTLLILGGSQGAVAVNEAVTAATARLGRQLDGWRIVHQAGREQAGIVRERYARLGIEAIVEAFFDEMAARYSDADLVVSRAGATTLAEMACAGLPSVLIPYPHAVGDHQSANARSFLEADAAEIVFQSPDANRTARKLEGRLRGLLDDDERRRRMGRASRSLARPDASERVADEVARLTDVAIRPLLHRRSA